MLPPELLMITSSKAVLFIIAFLLGAVVMFVVCNLFHTCQAPAPKSTPFDDDDEDDDEDLDRYCRREAKKWKP